MKRLLVYLFVLVSFGFTLSAQTYTVRVYDMTPRYSTYTPQKTPTIKLPESNQKTYTYTDYLEEQLRVKRLQAELRELERRESSNQNNTSTTQLTSQSEIIQGYYTKGWIPIMLKVIRQDSNIIIIGFKEKDKQWIETNPVTAQKLIDNKVYSHFVNFEEGRICFNY